MRHSRNHEWAEGERGGFMKLRLGTNCGNIFGKQIGNVFVFTICFDVGLAVLC